MENLLRSIDGPERLDVKRIAIIDLAIQINKEAKGMT